MVAVSEKPKVAEFAEAPKSVRLAPNALKEESFERRRWLFRCPPGTTQDDVRTGSFYARVAKQFRRHDIISALAPDESWEMECRVETVKMDWVEVSVSKVYARTGVGKSTTLLGDDFCTEYAAGQGWGVKRISDGHFTIVGHATEGAAVMQWHREQPRVVA